MQCNELISYSFHGQFCNKKFPVRNSHSRKGTTSKPQNSKLRMDLRTTSFLIYLLSVAQGSNDPQIKSRIYIGDYSVALQGILISESSWSSNRLPPTTENSRVSCATACVDLFRRDVSCNSIMYVKETKECHMGYTSLPNGNEATEFVYRIPNGKGEVLLLGQ